MATGLAAVRSELGWDSENDTRTETLSRFADVILGQSLQALHRPAEAEVATDVLSSASSAISPLLLRSGRADIFCKIQARRPASSTGRLPPIRMARRATPSPGPLPPLNDARNAHAEPVGNGPARLTGLGSRHHTLTQIE